MRRIRFDEASQRSRHSGVFAGEIRADDLPTCAPIGGLEHDIGSKVKRTWVSARKDQRRGSVKAVFAGAQHDGRNILRLPGCTIETGSFPAIDDVWIERIGRDVAIFLDPDGIPVAERNLAKIATA